MKCSILSDNFKKSISLIERSTGKDLTLPILGSFLITAEKGTLSITGTNLEIGLRTTIRASIQKEGSVVIPARVLSSFISTIKKDEKISLEVKDQDLEIEIGNQKTKLKGFSQEDFPPFPVIKEIYAISFDRDQLHDALTRSLVSVSRSNIKPELASVYFVLDASKAVLVATDSFRLSEERLQLQATSIKGKQESFLLPLRTSEELLRVLEYTQEQEIKILVGKGDIMIQLGETMLYSRLTEGGFPAYQQIIPQKFNTTVTLKKSNILEHLKRASLFSNKLNGVTLSFLLDDKQCFIESSNRDIGEYQASFPIEITGQDLKVVFNHYYLTEGIESFSEDTLFFGLNSESQPLVIRQGNTTNALYIVMPMKAEV